MHKFFHLRFGWISALLMMGATVALVRLNMVWWPSLLAFRGCPFIWLWPPFGIKEWCALAADVFLAMVFIAGVGVAAELLAARAFKVSGDRFGWLAVTFMILATAVAADLNLRMEPGIFHGFRGTPFAWFRWGSDGAYYYWWALLKDILVALPLIIGLGILVEKTIATISKRRKKDTLERTSVG